MQMASKLFHILALLFLLFVSFISTSIHAKAGELGATSPSFQGTGGRMLVQRSPMRASMTCDVYPRICRSKGSPGRDCCGRQCVNVDKDESNCGRCGRRCRYGEMCCAGTCVNVSYDRENCGSCGNRCKKRSLCRYGMCSYA